MPITINGSGTVTGISAGGLPDGCITTADLDSAVPVAKAWVNFNGTGAVAIRASYNVSSITDNDTGDYRVNFTNAFADTNYCVVQGGEISRVGSAYYGFGTFQNSDNTTTYARIRLLIASGGGWDAGLVNVAVFR